MEKVRLYLLYFLSLLFINSCGVLSPSSVEKGSASTSFSLVGWDSLPLVNDRDLIAGFKAWHSGCNWIQKRNPTWAPVCQQAETVAKSEEAPAIRRFLKQHLDVYAIKNKEGTNTGLITGYFEPVYPGHLTRTEEYSIPVYGVPNDLITVALENVYPEKLHKLRLRGRLENKTILPYWDGSEISKRTLDAPILAWMKDPLDLQFMQVQGSGRLTLPDASELRLGYANVNGHRYCPIGRWLSQTGEVAAGKVSMQVIREWAKQHPERVPQMLAYNRSYVFFQKLPPTDAGPVGAMNTPLTAEYSMAADKDYLPLGSMAWLDTTYPTPENNPLQRLMAIQDVGGAIVGEVRADFFWGRGHAAGEMAGRMKQKGKIWLLWPKHIPLPAAPPTDPTLPSTSSDDPCKVER